MTRGLLNRRAAMAADLSRFDLSEFGNLTTADYTVPYALESWHRWGCNVFELSEHMLAAFLLTDLGQAERPTPFPAFAVTVPPGFLVDGGFEYRVVNYSSILVQGSGEPGVLCLIQALSDTVPTLVSATSFRELEVAQRGFEDSDVVLNRTETDIVRKVHRVFGGLCAWLASCPTDMRHPVKRPTSVRQPRNWKAPRWFEVGKTVRLGPHLIRAAKELDNPIKRSEWKLSSRHVVRGHYRNQVCGVGRADRKTIWVQPFWRGPEGEKAWAHIYKVTHTPGQRGPQATNPPAGGGQP